MNSANKLLDKFAVVCKHKSDKAIADALRVRQSAVSNWRHERAHPDAESVERMCDATGESLSRWLPLIESERARSPAARKAWLRLAQAAAAVVLAVGAAQVPAHAHAVAGSAAHNPGTVYIMSNNK